MTLARSANCILLLLIANSVFAIQYITTFQDPAISPRSSFAYQPVNTGTLPYKYIAAFGYDGNRSLPEADQFEYHDVESRISSVAQTDVNFPTISYPIVTIKRFGFASLTGIQTQPTNSTPSYPLTQVAPGFAKGVSSAISEGSTSNSTVYFSIGYNPDTNTTLNYAITLLVNKLDPSKVGFGYTTDIRYTTRAGVVPQLLEDLSTGQITVFSFSGWNASVNTFAPDWLRFDGKTLGNLAPTGGPSPRAFYSTVIQGVTKVVFVGGKNATTYFNDVFVFQLVSQTWTRITVTGDGTYGLPAPRIGHSLNTLQDRQNVVYMFGGTDGTNFYNDLWSLTFTGTTTATWARLDDPSDPLHTRVTPRAFHKGGDLFNDTTSVLFYLGGVTANGTTPPAIAVDVSKTCDYYCQNLPEVCLLLGNTRLCSQKGGCTTFDVCQRATACTASQIKCGINCVDSNSAEGFAGCPARLPAFPCSGATPFTCWNSFCAASAAACSVVPPCPINTHRCADGTCSPNRASCSAHKTCGVSETECPDGTCVPTGASCTRFLGCTGSDPSESFQCADGTCRADISQCEVDNSRNCTDGQVPCWDDCYSNYSSCVLPHWSRAIRPRSDQVTVNQGGGNAAALLTEYFSTPLLLTSNHYFLRVDNRGGSPVKLEWNISIPTINPMDPTVVGPHPTWTQESSPDFLCSIIADIKTSGITSAIGTGSVDVNIIIRHQFQKGDPNPILPGKLCFGSIVPWYWNDTIDADPSSPLANVSYFAKYRQWYREALVNSSGTTPDPKNMDFGQPLFRWACINKGTSETENQWPRWLNTSNDIANQTQPDQWHGILLLEDLNGPVGIIKWNKTTVDAPNYVAPEPAAPNELAHWIVLGLVSVALLILVVVVTMKACARQN